MSIHLDEHPDTDLHAHHADLPACFAGLDDLDGNPDEYLARQLPEVYTFAIPGTPEKLAVMRERVEQQHAIFHPLDARIGDDRPDVPGVYPSDCDRYEDKEDPS